MHGTLVDLRSPRPPAPQAHTLRSSGGIIHIYHTKPHILYHHTPRAKGALTAQQSHIQFTQLFYVHNT